MISYPLIYANGQDVHTKYSCFNEHVGDYLAQVEKSLEELKDVAGASDMVPTNIKIGKVQLGNTYQGIFFNSFNTTQVNVGDRKQREKNSADRVLLMILGSFITGVALFKIAEWWRNSNEAKEEIASISSFKGSLSADLKRHKSNKHLKDISTIINTEKKVFDRIKYYADTKLALMVTIAVSGIFLTLGALAASPEFIIAGVVLLFAAGMASILTWSWEHFDKAAPFRDAKICKEALARLKNASEAIPTVKQ